MLILKRGVAALTVAVVLLGSASSVHADTPWADPTGTADYFDWANGRNTDTNFFGSPTLVGGNAFRFSPIDFRAEALDGATSSASDTATWDVTAHAGVEFTEVRIIEHGDYSISGSHADNSTSVTTNVAAGIYGAANDYQEWTTEGAGPWSVDLTIDLSDVFPPVTAMEISVQNDLLAVSGGAGNVCWIEKKFTGAIIDVFVVPEPATALMLTLGGLALIRRRR